MTRQFMMIPICILKSQIIGNLGTETSYFSLLQVEINRLNVDRKSSKYDKTQEVKTLKFFCTADKKC